MIASAPAHPRQGLVVGRGERERHVVPQFDVSGHYPIASKCSDFTTDTTTGQADLKLTT